MMWCTRALCRVALIALIPCGCQPPPAAPWTLLELGDGPITEALDGGALILALTEDALPSWPGMLIPGDTALAARIARRDLLTLPSIMCGDRMSLRTGDLPLSLTRGFGWPPEDSLTVRWTCMDRGAFARFAEAFVTRAQSPAMAEVLWLATLRQWWPDSLTTPDIPYAPGAPVHLDILAERPDGSMIGEPVHLDFYFGDADQVVPALLPGLERAGAGAHWSVWSSSADAFGSGPHPELGLPAFTPVRFRVEAR